MVRTYTAQSLQKWSFVKRDLPLIPHVRALHIYDFDNTLFKSPLPNTQLWTGPTAGHLQNESYFANGGWWHDVHILEATGKGVAVEEPRAWSGWWNEHVVQLARMSIAERDVLTVMLTGRSEQSHAELIERMLAAKGLEFDMVCLKRKLGPKNERFASTEQFKTALLTDLIFTFSDATELRIYEDRPKHVRAFREFAEKLNSGIRDYPEHSRQKTIATEVVAVPEDFVTLDPLIEVKEVQRMVNAHNRVVAAEPGSQRKTLMIRRQVFFTGYLLKPEDSKKLIGLIDCVGRPEAAKKEGEYKFFANNVLISPRPSTEKVLREAGGMGKRQLWKVTSIGAYERDRLYAARVAPVPEDSDVSTHSDPPNIVLTCRKGTKTTEVDRIRDDAWKSLPEDKQLIFETTVGEKVQLSVEEEGSHGKWGAGKRKFGEEGEISNGGRIHDDRRHNGRGGRGGGGRGRGRGGGDPGAKGDRDDRRDRRPAERRSGGRARGGARGGYRSLDDVGDNSRYAIRPQGRFDVPYDDGGYDTAFPPMYGTAGNDSSGMDESGGLKY